MEYGVSTHYILRTTHYFLPEIRTQRLTTKDQQRRNMLNNIFLSVPIDYLEQEQKLIEKKKFNLELKIFAHHLDNYNFSDFVDFNNFLKSLNLRLTFHAPFVDMRPGSFDEKIRLITLDRFINIIDLASIFKPENIVFHAGFFEPIEGWFFDKWFNNAMKTWNKVKKYCEKINQKFSIENVFEKDYTLHKKLLNKIDSNLCGICLDVAHHNVFAKNNLKEWFKEFREKIFELHIHDNDGEKDWHWAVGDGEINFKNIFIFAKKYCPDAILTLEAHDKDTMLKTYERVVKLCEQLFKE